MLSILIPSYNYDCTQLVADLRSQCELIVGSGQLVSRYEIIVADDGSTLTDTIEANSVVATWPGCRFVRYEHNLGRSAIRNRLAHEAQGKYLLYADQDAKVTDRHFVQNMLTACIEGDVACGRMVQSPTPPPPQFTLRYEYERRFERKMGSTECDTSAQYPFRSFCFIIRKDIATKVQMDETFSGYGYEDVLYGMELEKAGYTIRHTASQLQNDELEPNPLFVAKSEEAMRTLYTHQDKLRGGVRMLDVADKMQRWHITPLLHGLGKLTAPPLRRNLCSNHPWTGLFNLYKLLYYIGLQHT